MGAAGNDDIKLSNLFFWLFPGLTPTYLISIALSGCTRFGKSGMKGSEYEHRP